MRTELLEALLTLTSVKDHRNEKVSILLDQFALVTWRPYCPGRPEKLCFTTPSLAVETMGVRLGVAKQSFFGPPGQYGGRVTRANG